MKSSILIAIAVSISLSSGAVLAKKNANKKGDRVNCPITHAQLETALTSAANERNGQYPLDMWGTVVNKYGRVCAVAKTGDELNHQWLASRVISAQKAYTSVSLSNNSNSMVGASVAFSSAGLYGASSPGGPLYGLQHSNPVDTKWAYHGNSKRFGTTKDPMKGRYVGGINVFGGGLALFDAEGKVIGAVGVSGNTSCADHNIAWRVRGEFAKEGLAQGAQVEFNIHYKGDLDADGVAGAYPICGDDATGTDLIDDTWEDIGLSADGTEAPNYIGQFFADYP